LALVVTGVVVGHGGGARGVGGVEGLRWEGGSDSAREQGETSV
jgi:hypothetical protein